MREHGFTFSANELRQPNRIRCDRSYKPKYQPHVVSPHIIRPENRARIFDWVYNNTSECSAAQLLAPKPLYCESHTFAPDETGHQIDLLVKGEATPFNARKWEWERRTQIGTKRSLFRRFTIDSPDIKISLSHFYTMIAPISRMKRRTDQCGKCDRLNYLEKIGDQMQKSNYIIPDELETEIDLLVVHRQQADVQRALFKQMTASLGEGEVQEQGFLDASHSFIAFNPPEPSAIPTLEFHGLVYCLNYRQINGKVEATGLHTEDPSKWDSLKYTESYTIPKEARKQFAPVTPSFEITTGPTQLRTIEQRFLNISPIERSEIGFPLQDRSPSIDDQSSFK
ncbi:hypothetical protein BLNAU_23595 [Blattamonas nauphoetae]|uniref:Uncharacterized protein n=1 Tax=Blattamonas nauphoetae TaxID=2049346 RepID=A0ABQ9WPS9_9EUKA|nr:hypothetical protein BLNAU_23595 [Blattamonas nauphoetae]